MSIPSARNLRELVWISPEPTVTPVWTRAHNFLINNIVDNAQERILEAIATDKHRRVATAKLFEASISETWQNGDLRYPEFIVIGDQCEFCRREIDPDDVLGEFKYVRVSDGAVQTSIQRICLSDLIYSDRFANELQLIFEPLGYTIYMMTNASMCGVSVGVYAEWSRIYNVVV